MVNGHFLFPHLLCCNNEAFALLTEELKGWIGRESRKDILFLIWPKEIIKVTTLEKKEAILNSWEQFGLSCAGLRHSAINNSGLCDSGDSVSLWHILIIMKCAISEEIVKFFLLQNKRNKFFHIAPLTALLLNMPFNAIVKIDQSYL